jgi:N-acyl homoserine lactone hydrolase
MVAIDPGDVLRGVELAKNKRLVTVNGDLVNVLPGIDARIRRR